MMACRAAASWAVTYQAVSLQCVKNSFLRANAGWRDSTSGTQGRPRGAEQSTQVRFVLRTLHRPAWPIRARSQVQAPTTHYARDVYTSDCPAVWLENLRRVQAQAHANVDTVGRRHTSAHTASGTRPHSQTRRNADDDRPSSTATRGPIRGAYAGVRAPHTPSSTRLLAVRIAITPSCPRHSTAEPTLPRHRRIKHRRMCDCLPSRSNLPESPLLRLTLDIGARACVRALTV